MPLPLLRHKIVVLCRRTGGDSLPVLRHKTMGLFRKQPEACLLCRTADMSAVSHSRPVCCITQQTCLLCHLTECPQKVITLFRTLRTGKPIILAAQFSKHSQDNKTKKIFILQELSVYIYSCVWRRCCLALSLKSSARLVGQHTNM